MNAIALAVTNGHVTTTSRQIAEVFGKQHYNILKAIANLDCSEEFRRVNFDVAHYLDEQGKPRQEYAMTRDGFTFLCMGFTGKEAAQWKEKYIAAFNAMEQALKTSAPPAPKKLTCKPAVDLYFAALHIYAGMRENKAAFWIGLSEVVFSKLGIRSLDELTTENVDHAIHIVASDCGQMAGAMIARHYAPSSGYLIH